MKAIKKYKKTYAIMNLAEKHTVFHLGKTKVRVSFTGGIVTKKGVTPATFTTDDPIVQFAIENSNDFKEGAVTLLSQYPMPGEVKIGRNEPEPPTLEPPTPPALKTELFRQATQELESPAPEIPNTSEQETTEEKADNLLAAETEDEEADAPEEKAQETNNLEVIEVSCKDVAKQYLQEHYDEKPTPLRTIADVQECAAKYGITFNFV